MLLVCELQQRYCRRMYSDDSFYTLSIYGQLAVLVLSIAMLMVLNFHFASGIIFTYGYLTNGYGLPVLGGLFALAAGGAGLPFGVSLSRRT